MDDGLFTRSLSLSQSRDRYIFITAENDKQATRVYKKNITRAVVEVYEVGIDNLIV